MADAYFPADLSRTVFACCFSALFLANAHAAPSPWLPYAGYLGGRGWDEARAVAVDSSGNLYLTGVTASADFPVTANGGRLHGQTDAFVVKLSPDGQTVLYATYLGGSGAESGLAIAVDAAGQAYVAGSTDSADFPRINSFNKTASDGSGNGFIAKLSADGQRLLYASTLGGTGTDAINGIALDRNGSAYITGLTESNDFPVVMALYPQSHGQGDAFVSKLSPDGQRLLYSTYWGGSQRDWGAAIAVDDNGQVVVTGGSLSDDFPSLNAGTEAAGGAGDAFMLKLNRDAQRAIYSQRWGGSGWEDARALGLDGEGNAYIVGTTLSANLPAFKGDRHQGRGDAFVSKFADDGRWLFARYLGGNDSDEGLALAVDRDGNVTVAGKTQSYDLPNLNALQIHHRGGSEGFIAQLSPDGRRWQYASYFGGVGEDVHQALALDAKGQLYVAGVSTSADLNQVNPPQTTFDEHWHGNADAFVHKLSLQRSALPYLLSSDRLDFGSVNVGQTRRLSIKISNVSAQPLSLNAETVAPYRLIGAAQFSLAPGATQSVVLAFEPSSPGLYTQILNIDHAGQRNQLALNAVAVLPESRAPRLMNTVLQGVPGETLTLRGSHFGNPPGQLLLNGRPLAVRQWRDTRIVFDVPNQAPGTYRYSVVSSAGRADNTLDVLADAPSISRVLPNYGGSAMQIWLEGHRLGPASKAGSVQIGDRLADVLAWSDQRLLVKIPDMADARTQMAVQTLRGAASTPFRVRNLALASQYGRCDSVQGDACPALTVNATGELAQGQVDVQISNRQPRWYSLNLAPRNVSLPGATQFALAPYQTLTLNGVRVNDQPSLQVQASALDAESKRRTALQLLYRWCAAWRVQPAISVAPERIDAAEAWLDSHRDTTAWRLINRISGSLQQGERYAVLRVALSVVPSALSNDEMSDLLSGPFQFSAALIRQLKQADWSSETAHLLSVIDDTLADAQTPRFATVTLQP